VINNLLKTLIYILVLFLVFNTNQFSQVPDSIKYSNLYPFIVDSIKIQGNETTENFIILKELTFTIGDTINATIISYNRERIYSLGIFNRVKLIPQKLDGKNILNINVEESWYIYPIPFVYYKENDFKKLSYGLSVRIKNFRGRNEELSGIFAFGYDPTFYLRYYNPNISGRENIFFRTELGYADIANKSPSAELLYGGNFSQKYYFIRLLAGKRFGLFHRLSFTTSYNYIETPFFIPKINASDNRIDNLVDLGIGYEYDTRDLVQFPKNGIYTNLSYTFKGLSIDKINYSVAWIDFREYRDLFENLIAKWRIASRLTFGGNIPYYDYSIIGLDDKIRGHYNKKIEGNNYYFTSLQLYYPIIDELNIDLTFIPLIPKQLLSYRIGFYTQIFIETGAAQLKGKPLTFSDFNSGYGAGLTLLILPYNVARIDFALDEYKNLETIFNLGISF
jgi:outer membrane protein assembly factor BamA